VPQLDPGVVKALVDGEVERIDREKEDGPGTINFPGA
jgi:hypothetical protein